MLLVENFKLYCRKKGEHDTGSIIFSTDSRTFQSIAEDAWNAAEEAMSDFEANWTKRIEAIKAVEAAAIERCASMIEVYLADHGIEQARECLSDAIRALLPKEES